MRTRNIATVQMKDKNLAAQEKAVGRCLDAWPVSGLVNFQRFFDGCRKIVPESCHEGALGAMTDALLKANAEGIKLVSFYHGIQPVVEGAGRGRCGYIVVMQVDDLFLDMDGSRTPLELAEVARLRAVAWAADIEYSHYPEIIDTDEALELAGKVDDEMEASIQQLLREEMALRMQEVLLLETTELTRAGRATKRL